MKVMNEMMSRMMKPEDMRAMMAPMMKKMLATMTPEERMEFVATTMPRCLDIVFAELEPEARERLARDMIERMTAIARENLPAAEPTSAGGADYGYG